MPKGCGTRSAAAGPAARVGAAVDGLDANGDVFGRDLGVLHIDVEEPPLVEDAGVQQLEFRAVPAAPPVLLDQLAIRKLGLRIAVEEPHVGVRGRVVQVIVVLLHVLAVVALRRRDAEQPFLDDRVATVPECRGEDQQLVAVAQRGDAVLAPAICLGRRMVERQILPGVAIRADSLLARRPRSGRKRRGPNGARSGRRR